MENVVAGAMSGDAGSSGSGSSGRKGDVVLFEQCALGLLLAAWALFHVWATSLYHGWLRRESFDPMDSAKDKFKSYQRSQRFETLKKGGGLHF